MSRSSTTLITTYCVITKRIRRYIGTKIDVQSRFWGRIRNFESLLRGLHADRVQEPSAAWSGRACCLGATLPSLVVLEKPSPSLPLPSPFSLSLSSLPRSLPAPWLSRARCRCCWRFTPSPPPLQYVAKSLQSPPQATLCPPAASPAIAVAGAGRQSPPPSDRRQQPWSGRGRLWLGEGQALVRPGRSYPGWPPPPADAPPAGRPDASALLCCVLRREVEEEGVNRK